MPRRGPFASTLFVRDALPIFRQDFAVNLFHCDTCGEIVYFENTQCLNCGSLLAFLPALMDLSSLTPGGGELWKAQNPRASPEGYRLCANRWHKGLCNEAIPADAPESLCFVCRFTEIIPDLSIPENLPRWARLHTAQRRLIYSLKRLRLPLRNRTEDPDTGLAFRFLADTTEKVMTGHRNGVITLALAEADDAERERRRVEMGEEYRTLLGHFRHEVGHYYWDRLIRDRGRLDDFRARFGDETLDYGQALQRHHQQGPPPDWSSRFISAYAASHPWEDWAETWAHYLHHTDLIETAAACGIGADRPGMEDFDALIARWIPLSRMLNTLNRSLGLNDAYPFVLAEQVIEKLRFVHELVVRPAGSPP